VKPIIGIAPDFVQGQYRLDPRYVEFVRSGGGTPMILPLEASLDSLDGLLLTGGRDIRASRWGQRTHPKAELMDAARERSDFRLLAAVERRGLPILAICLGIQVLNVARGGSLVQDLPAPGKKRRHPVTVEGRLADLLGRRLRVNSFHHQGLGRVGRGLCVTARADDGVIEAIEDPRRRFLVGVQWHPERMSDQTPLMRAFVRACR
jgi:gamma-glutamyl-gamma-aminobutyrate hydrolase PuuD